MKRFRLSMESLETRETPAALASVIDMVVDSYNPSASGDSYYGTGVYKSLDGGQTWAAETSGDESRHVRHRMFAIVDRTQLGGNDGIWIDTAAPVQTADAANETMTTDGARTETAGSAGPTVLLQRLANPEAAATRSGNVYTVTFGGSLVG
jgi:hypothetical protein